MSRLLAFPVAVAALLVLAGCSGGGDYSASDGDTAVQYAIAHSQGSLPDPLPKADRTRLLGMVQKYCEGVKATSISNMESAFDSTGGPFMQGVAERYCPSIMNSAKS